MRPRSVTWPLWLGVAALWLLHNDFWLWDDPSPVLGLPVGLVYHIAYCAAAALLMWRLVRRAWPAAGRPDSRRPGERP